ncbi:MAG: hypothetical protein WA581_04610 [Candidatus Acidiferrales bacterium]
MCRTSVRIELGYKLIEGADNKLAEGLAVTIGQGLAGDFLRETGRKAVVMVDPRVVVPHGGQVDQAVQRPLNVGQRPPAEILAGLFHVHSLG